MKSVQMQSFWQAKAPTVVGQPQTNPPRQRLSAALFALPFSPSSQSAFSSQSAVHVGPVPDTPAAVCAGESRILLGAGQQADAARALQRGRRHRGDLAAGATERHRAELAGTTDVLVLAGAAQTEQRQRQRQ